MLYKETQITILTTPEELRKIADKMEKQMATAKTGDSCRVHQFSHKNTYVFIAYDQFTEEREKPKRVDPIYDEPSKP